MATKRITDESENIEEADVIDGASDDITELQATLDDEIAALVGEFGGDELDNDWKIHVKRVVPNKGVLEHCFSAVPSELPLMDRIKEEYGPGAYTVYILNKNRLRKKPTIRIAEPIKKPTAQVVREGNQDLAALVATMAEQQRQTMQMMQESLRQQPAPPATDPVAMMSAMLGAMVQMKEFVQPQTTQSNPMEMLVKGIELARDLGGGNSDRNLNDALVDLAKEFGPPILALATQEKTQGSKPVNGTAIVPTPTNQGNSQPMTQPEPSQSTVQVSPAFQSQLNMLVAKAAQNAEPALYADLIADNVPADQLQQFLAQPDPIEYLISINPDVRTYRTWFERLQSELNEILTPEVEDAISTGNNSSTEPVDEIAGGSESSQDT